MDEKQKAKNNLGILLSDFSSLYDKGTFKGQSEATARTWVERFLSVFGWNASDPNEVRQEYGIKGRAARRLKAEGSTHRRPDYCLISNTQRVIYIDVKKIDANIFDDSSISYQVRCYGWSEGFTVSYAFDFEELAVYDCRIKPNASDDVHIARLKYFTFSQYLDNFEDLWKLFSKSEIDSGSLHEILPGDKRTHGIKTLDQDFEEKLSYWRKELAKVILRYGKVRDSSILSAAAQRIIDRIVFLRISEEFGFEELGTLLDMAHDKDGFWPLFLEQHEKRYTHVYDGILFPASGEDDPTGVDAHLRSWWLKGRIFREIIESLYYPNPYRFDVVPIELIGGIYEKYLGKRLRVVGNDVDDEFKPEYQRTKGAVYTPPWIVKRIVKKTLSPIVVGKNPEQILGLRILDPSCGSAGFLLGVFDYLESYIIQWFEKNEQDPQRIKFMLDTEEGAKIHPDIAKHLINNCIYGVDIDPEAVEVARMSLALRYLEGIASLSGEPANLLHGIGMNIRQGNSLVNLEVNGLGFDNDALTETMPFDWTSATVGFGTVMSEGGFDAVVGNPPYIEVKRYKEWMPLQYRYLKESGYYETTVQGKTDIAMPFMERGLGLLKKGGRLGYIIQNRFFKTDYGSIVRAWLRKNRAIDEIEDFRDIQIFPGRTTYTAIIILQKNSPRITYSTYAEYSDAVSSKPCLTAGIEWANIDDEVWSFDQPDLLAVHSELAKKHGTLAHRKELHISVGLQTLYGKLYQFEPVEVKPRTIVGKNGEGEIVTLEKAALRPLCRNRGFYPFRTDSADAWVIFPYDIIDGEAAEIGWKEFKDRFPKTATYLEDRKKKLLKAVEVPDGANRWHLYTRPQNLVSQARKKVLFPMTIEDTMAAVDHAGDVYQDNVNINSITLTDASKAQLNAIAAVINSSTFNALARLKAGLNEAGWRKFNRQYAELVPFPECIYTDNTIVSPLSSLAEKLSDLQCQALTASGEGARSSIRAGLERLWGELDAAVDSAYQLSEEQIKVTKRYPRRLNRYELLFRQADTTEAES